MRTFVIVTGDQVIRPELRSNFGEFYSGKYMLFAGWEVRIVKNCDRGLGNAARGLKLTAAFSSPR